MNFLILCIELLGKMLCRQTCTMQICTRRAVTDAHVHYSSMDTSRSSRNSLLSLREPSKRTPLDLEHRLPRLVKTGETGFLLDLGLRHAPPADNRAVRYKLKSCTIPIFVPFQFSNVPAFVVPSRRV